MTMGTMGIVKACTKCGITKPLDQFHRENRTKDGRRANCKQCVSALGKQYREQNHEHIIERQRQWREQNRDYAIKYNREYQDKNPDYWPEHRKKNKQRRNEYSKQYFVANRDRLLEARRVHRKQKPEMNNLAIRRRRARKHGAVQQRWVVDSTLGAPGLCWWCGNHLDPERTHIDHVMPISLGGPAKPSNEVLACQLCNQRKNRKHPLVWVAELVTQEGESQ